MLQLITPRLILREFSTGDAPALHRICTQPHILHWFPDWDMTPEEVGELLPRLVDCYAHIEEMDRDGVRVVLAVTEKASGDLMGMVGVANKEQLDNEVEIAYFLAAEHLGQGYAKEIVAAMADWAVDRLKLPYLVAIVETDNIPSQRVVEHCGFRRLETRMIKDTGFTQEKPFHYYRRYQEGGA